MRISDWSADVCSSDLRMSGRLTTHVLDTASGRPAAGVHVEAFRLSGAAREPLASLITNGDGRCDRPLLEGAAFTAGTYELVFHVAAYFRGRDRKSVV